MPGAVGTITDTGAAHAPIAFASASTPTPSGLYTAKEVVPAAEEIGESSPWIVAHYTNAPADAFRNGMWEGTSFTTNFDLTASETAETLCTQLPDKIIPVINNGTIIIRASSGGIVGARRGAGGGVDLYSPVRLGGSHSGRDRSE